jgi:hypothetical protein
MTEMWPQLKKEGIESIRFCYAMSPEYGYDTLSDFRENVNTFGFRERVAEVVKWWPTTNKVPKEKLSEFIEIIDESIKKADGTYISVSQIFKMMIITGKGNYIFLFPGEKCVSDELSKFLVEYCKPSHEHWFALPSKEQTEAIVIFSIRHTKDLHDSMLVWPPIALFGDKNEAEKLLDRSFEPEMVFEGREWLDKILDAYEIANKEAKEAHYRINDSSVLKGWIVFLTQDEFYWKGIGIGDNTVIGESIKESKQLKAYFDELGLTKELLAGEPNAAPKADKVNAH